MKRSGPIKRKKPLRSKKRLQSKKRMERGAGPKRKKRIGVASKAKREKRFKRQYGSSEYVEWLHQWECAICGVTGWTQAAHTKGGGMGRKADADTLAPLCGNRQEVEGCHARFDNRDPEIEHHRFRLQQLAKQLRKRFLETRTESED